MQEKSRLGVVFWVVCSVLQMCFGRFTRVSMVFVALDLFGRTIFGVGLWFDVCGF